MKQFSQIDPSILVGRIFSGVGLIFMVVVFLLLWLDQKKARNSSRVIGTVSSLDYGSSGTAAPVIGYRVNGKKQYIHGTVWSSPPSYEVGEEVELLISGSRPDQVIINSFFERYFLISLFGFFATVFGGIGVALLTLMKK